MAARSTPSGVRAEAVGEPDPAPSGRLAGRVALVTGASRGLGAAVARAYAAEGAQVVLAGRTVGALEEVYDAIAAAGGTAVGVPVDLAQHDRIDDLAATLYERFGKLDILVGNAADLGTLGPVAHGDPKRWQAVLDVNLTANFRLIRAFDPLLRRSDAGRAIFVTAAEARADKAFWGAYAVSKAALETLVRTYAAEVRRTAVRVNLVDPGVLATRLRAHAFPGEKPEDLPQPDSATAPFVDLAEPACTRHGETVSP